MLGKLTIKEPKAFTTWNLYIKDDGEFEWEEDFSTKAEAVDKAELFLNQGIDCVIESESVSYGTMYKNKMNH